MWFILLAFRMKKIILWLAMFCICFLWFSTSLYLDVQNCSSQWQCNSQFVIDNCLPSGNILYIIGHNTNHVQSTWTVSFCSGQLYWKTGIISWVWCYGYRKCCDWTPYNNNKKCCAAWWTVYSSGNKCCDPWKVVIGNQCKACQSLTSWDIANNPGVHATCDDHGCDTGQQYSLGNWLVWCCAWVVENWECKLWAAGIWIRLNPQCLVNWQCGMNVYTMLGIRQSNENPTVMWLIQDVILAATTFVWTLIVFALVISWLVFAFWSVSWKDTKRAKTIIIDCFVWLLCVMGSYVIVRLIQFVATAWS